MIAKFAAPGEIIAGSRAIFLLRPAEPRDAAQLRIVRPHGSPRFDDSAVLDSTCPVYPNRFTGNLVDKPAADALGVTLTLSRWPNETTITRTLRSTGSA